MQRILSAVQLNYFICSTCNYFEMCGATLARTHTNRESFVNHAMPILENILRNNQGQGLSIKKIVQGFIAITLSTDLLKKSNLN